MRIHWKFRNTVGIKSEICCQIFWHKLCQTQVSENNSIASFKDEDSHSSCECIMLLSSTFLSKFLKEMRWIGWKPSPLLLLRYAQEIALKWEHIENQACTALQCASFWFWLVGQTLKLDWVTWISATGYRLEAIAQLKFV